MKKFILPLALCLLTCTACLKEGTFSVTNLVDIVTTKQGLLVNDEGTSYNVTQNQAGSEDWRQEGSRLYILCDVLNRQLDIRLKSFSPVLVQDAIPLSDMDYEGQDPIAVTDHSFSGGYLNLVIAYYYDPTSNYARNIRFYWEGRNTELHLYAYYDGNGESPAHMDVDALKGKEVIYSIPLMSLLETGSYNSIHLTFYELYENKTVEKGTYRLTTNV